MAEQLKNPAAERSVLAGLCQYGIEFFYEIDYLEPEAFYEINNQRLFKCFDRIFKESSKIDLSAILSTATEMGFYEEIANDSEIGYIRSLFNMGINKENAEINASKIAKLMYANRASVVAKSIENRLSQLSGEESIHDIISILETPVLDFSAEIYNTSDNTPVRPADTIEEKLAERESNPVDILGISTGCKNYDKAIGGGLRRKAVDLIGARMKVGKSFTGDSICINIASRGIPVLVVDSEMDQDEHDNRMLAALSGVELDKIETGKYINNTQETKKVREGVEKFKKMNYKFVNTTGLKFGAVLGIIRNFIYRDVGFDENGKTKDCVIIYDYFKITNATEITDAMREHQLMSYQMMELYNFAVKFDVPILSFVQLNRDGITSENTDAVAGSDGVLRTCTSFSILKEKSEEEIAQDGENRGNRKIVPIIARYGAGLEPGDYINYKYNFKYGATVEELETRNYYLRTEEGFELDDTAESDIPDF